MNKHNTLLQNNQDSQKSFLELVKQDPENTLRDYLTPSELKILDLCLAQSNKYDVCYQSQGSMGKWVNYCTKTINRAVGLFNKIGLVNKENRGSNKTCIYTPHPIFKTLAMSSRLRHILPGIWLPMQVCVMYASSGPINTNVPRLNINVNPPVYLNSVQQPMVHSHPTKIIGARAYAYRNFWSSNTDGWNSDLKSYLKGEIMKESVISPRIEAFKVMNLTLRGKIEFMPYPDEAIDYTEDAMSRVTTPIFDPISYARKLCKSYCEKIGVVPEWPMIPNLLLFYGQSADAPMLVDKTIKKTTSAKRNDYPQKRTNSHKQETRKPIAWSEPTPYKRTKPTAEFIIPEEKKGFVSMQALLFQSILKLNQEMPEAIKTTAVNDNSADEPPLIDYDEYDEEENMFIHF